MAEKARRFRGSVPVFTPQRGWKPADTTVNLSAAIGRKSPEARKRLLGKVGRRRHVSYVKKLIERKLPAGGKKEAVDKKYAAGGNKRKSYWEQWAAGGKSL